MPTSTISARGSITGLASGSRSLVTAEAQNSSCPGQVESVILTTGDNTIDVPTSSKGCIITFASGSTSTKKLKGAGGDTGITLNQAGWNILSFPPTPPTIIIINSSTIDTGNRTTIEFL